MGLLGNNFTRWMGLKAAKQRKDEASRRDSDIGRQLKLEKEKAKKTFKILLVGAGGSGKSTIIKQMGIVYPNALSEDERSQMTRINESSFELDSIKVQILDVDIQEPRRKKWLNCFEDVGYMIFVAALSNYDQHTAEGHNAMHDEMMLFDSLANDEQFKHKPIIVFLNKLDVFEKKIAVSPLSEYFTDFNGPDTNSCAAATYFADQFRGINKTRNREIHIYYTTANDPKMLQVTTASVHHMIIQENWRSAGL
ncbi:Guanine nucleotide-binding protein alpha-2 subunit [Penicillium chrysogenum]|uniref:Pc12g03830 protein n=2 Tax=Penicillium chrysogenum species complex TaxID=254878 RepID=B6GX03_PENRW|nr:Guanine nucleotide-binding protein alpha-2 subunit [Penicillium chrysogenum]CAP80010.1 Pc12g03830 [Penicillium rubens Wisconsin 54-1255]